jgi:hypothetical protein
MYVTIKPWTRNRNGLLQFEGRSTVFARTGLDILAYTVVTAARILATGSSIVLGGATYMYFFGYLCRRSPSGLDPATEETTQSVLYVQSTIHDSSGSTTAGYIPHNELELQRAGTLSHLQSAPVEQFPENHDFVEQSASHMADRAPR